MRVDDLDHLPETTTIDASSIGIVQVGRGSPASPRLAPSLLLFLSAWYQRLRLCSCWPLDGKVESASTLYASLAGSGELLRTTVGAGAPPACTRHIPRRHPAVSQTRLQPLSRAGSLSQDCPPLLQRPQGGNRGSQEHFSCARLTLAEFPGCSEHLLWGSRECAGHGWSWGHWTDYPLLWRVGARVHAYPEPFRQGPRC